MDNYKINPFKKISLQWFGGEAPPVLLGSRIANASRSWQAVQDVDVSGWIKTNDFIVAIGVNAASGKKITARECRLEWENTTDDPGTWTALAATGNLNWTGATNLTDGNDITTAPDNRGIDHGGFSYDEAQSEESEGSNSSTITLADGESTEFQFAVDISGAGDSKQYTFRLWNVTDGASIGTCSAQITTAAVGVTENLEGDIDGQSVVVGTLYTKRQFSGSVIGQSSIPTAEILRKRPFDGTIIGQSNIPTVELQVTPTDWGITTEDFTDYYYPDWVKAMSGILPDVVNMQLQGVSVMCGADHADQVRIAVYQGGSATDPEGATLVEDLGLTSGNDINQFIVVNSVTNPALAANTRTWIVIKGSGASFRTKVSDQSANAGDFRSDVANWTDDTIAKDAGTPYPATWPANGGSFATYWFAVYLTYDISAGVTRQFEGNINGQSTIQNKLQITRRLEGDIGGQSITIVDLQRTRRLNGNIQGQSALIGDFTITGAVSFSGAIQGQSVVQGSINKTAQLTGQIDGQSVVTGAFQKTIRFGGPIQGQSTTAGDLQRTRRLEGDLQGQSSIQGEIQKTAQFESQVFGQSVASGDLSISGAVDFSGTIAGQSIVSGDIQKTAEIAGAIQGQSFVSGELFNKPGFAGQIQGQSEVLAILNVTRGISATVNGLSSILADIYITKRLEVSVDASGIVSGTLSVITPTKPLAGAIEGQSIVTGAVSVLAQSYATLLKKRIWETLTEDSEYLSLLGNPTFPYQTFYIRNPGRPSFPEVTFKLMPGVWNQAIGGDLLSTVYRLELQIKTRDNGYEQIAKRIVKVLHQQSDTELGYRSVFRRSGELYDDDFNVYGRNLEFDVVFRRERMRQLTK